jgi:hypothetical protein
MKVFIIRLVSAVFAIAVLGGVATTSMAPPARAYASTAIVTSPNDGGGGTGGGDEWGWE